VRAFFLCSNSILLSSLHLSCCLIALFLLRVNDHSSPSNALLLFLNCVSRVLLLCANRQIHVSQVRLSRILRRCVEADDIWVSPEAPTTAVVQSVSQKPSRALARPLTAAFTLQPKLHPSDFNTCSQETLEGLPSGTCRIPIQRAPNSRSDLHSSKRSTLHTTQESSTISKPRKFHSSAHTTTGLKLTTECLPLLTLNGRQCHLSSAFR